MAFLFTDGFDCYSAVGDMILGYWDGGNVSFTLSSTGRFAGSRGVNFNSASTNVGGVFKNSGSNDAVHHICIAYMQTSAITGTSNQLWFTLGDGATAQCSVQFRSDGAILLALGASNGTVLATYTGAFTAQNTWYHYEIELIVSNTVGGMRVRKNGNTVADYDSFISVGNLDTASTANNYANRLNVGGVTGSNAVEDDLIWQSSASPGAWIGETRCRTRMPAADSGVQWTKSASTATMSVAPSSTVAILNTTSRYSLITPPFNGTVSSVAVTMSTGYTGNMKCAFFTAAGVVIQSATAILSNPVTGSNTFNFSPPLVLAKGVTYYFGFIPDTNVGGIWAIGVAGTGGTFTTTYAAFPSTATIGSAPGPVITATLNAAGDNYSYVNDPQQDAATSYVYSSNVNDTDRYTIAAIDTTPATTFCVTTRALLQKSDAGTRNTQVLLKSGSTEVATASAANNTTWGWQYRTDLTDPATGSAWTAVAVNNATIGVTVSA